jgi:hypothetical protein
MGSFRRTTLALLSPLPLIVLACSNDSAPPSGPVEAVCGNGVVEGTERCDVQSPGCAACAVLPNWTCDATGCKPSCADGGTDCADAERAGPCDMTGYWATRETNFTRDSVVGAVQTSSNWFLFRFEQEGDSYRVVESLDCGVHVTGSVTVDSSPATLKSSLYANRMDGAEGGRAARRGTSKAAANGCEMTFERWYRVRGATSAYLPPDFAAKPALASLTPLPSVTDPVNGTDVPAGSEDPDTDGIPGTSFLITSGFVNGKRNSAQRDWKEYATDPATPVPSGALLFEVPGSFDLEESVLRVTECGSTCALLKSTARAAQDIPGRWKLSFIGRSLGTPRVDAVVGGAPRANVDTDLTTCTRIRELVPHEGDQ